MPLRGNLFVKMFLGFWLVTITFMGTWQLSANYFDSRPPRYNDREHSPTGPPHRFVLRLMYDLQNLEGEQLAATISRARRRHDVDIYLLQAGGADLLGREVPADVVRAAEKLQGGRRRAFLDTAQAHLVAHEIYRRGQGPLRAVLVLEPPRGTLVDALGGSPWLRLGLAVLVSGLACFGLSRLMTNRLREMQLASRRLANGELDTRLEVRDRGGDETDELARDFNSMAGQLQQRIQAQKRLLGDVSHELRSPLARLRIALALTQEAPGDSDRYLARIEQEAVRLEELIGQLLSSQQRDVPLDERIDLVPLLDQLCEDASFEGQGQGKQVSFAPDTHQAIVDSSGDLLHKSFDNILRNALDHTPDNSQVNVVLRSVENGYEISVEDRGPGVPQEELDKLFEEFYRVDTARTREAGGYGLGLAITRRAILQHGGRVWAQNTGAGLQITVILPVHSRRDRC